MQNGANKRLANLKTKAETGLDYVMLKLDVISPFGKKKLKEMRPFYPGDEQLLNEELDRIQDIVDFIKIVFKGVSRKDAGHTWVKTRTKQSGQACFFEFLLISPLP